MADPERPAPTDVDYTDPRIGIFVPVPHASVAGACRVCHGASVKDSADSFYPTCWNCSNSPIGGVQLVVPISLAHKTESQLYAVARDYKSDAVGEEARLRHSVLLAATLQRFLREHEDCITAAAAGSWDTVTIVPSVRRQREGPHPLERVLGLSSTLAPTYHALLRPTGQPIGRKPNPAAFAALPEARDRSVLIVDDTMTSGSNIQSAAAALTNGGASVVAAVVIGRLVDTDAVAYPEKEEFWQRQKALGFDFGRCCLE